jgi:hypothetical protein
VAFFSRRPAPPPAPVAPPPRRWLWRVVVVLAVFGWRKRMTLAPLYVMFWLLIFGTAAHLPARGGTLAIGLGAVVGGVSLWLGLKQLARRGVLVLQGRQPLLVWSGYAAATGWMLQQSHRGITTFGMTWWLLLLAAGWITWAYQRSPHETVQVDEPPAEGVLVEQAPPLAVVIWNDAVRCQDGALPKSELTEVNVSEDGNLTTAEIMLVPGKQTTAMAMAATARVASAYGKPLESVVIEPSATARADRARLEGAESNEIYTPVPYDATWIVHNDGCIPLFYRYDGSRVWIRLWGEDEGASNIWISGDTKSGKSSTSVTCITQAVFTGRVIPLICDPQGGASLPVWGGIDGFAPVKARTTDEIEDVIDAVVRICDNRQAFINAVQWVDGRGNRRTGINRWSPAKCPDLPMLLLWIDEYPKLVAERPAVATKVDVIAKTGSKLGIAVGVNTQGTNMAENFAGSDSLRQNLQAGNIICHRNSSKVAGALALHNAAVMPHDIAATTPDGKNTKGQAIVQGCADPAPPPGVHRAVFQDQTEAYYWAGLAAQRMPAFHAVDLAGLAGEPAAAVVAPAAAAPATPETISVPMAATPAAPVLTVARGNESTIIKILRLLEEHGPKETGVIASRLGVNTSTVNMALKREETRTDGRPSRVRRVTHGVWGLAAPAQQQEPAQLVAA